MKMSPIFADMNSALISWGTCLHPPLLLLFLTFLNEQFLLKKNMERERERERVIFEVEYTKKYQIINQEFEIQTINIKCRYDTRLSGSRAWMFVKDTIEIYMISIQVRETQDMPNYQMVSTRHVRATMYYSCLPKDVFLVDVYVQLLMLEVDYSISRIENKLLKN